MNHTALDYVRRIVFLIFVDPLNEPIMLRPRRDKKREAGTGLGQRGEGVHRVTSGQRMALFETRRKKKEKGIYSRSLSIGVPIAGLSSGDEHPEAPFHLASEHHRLQWRLESLVLGSISLLIRLAWRKPWNTDPF